MKRHDNINNHGCNNINELLGMGCTPLLDTLFKLSSIASNFASAANNTKNISVSDKHEIEELLQIVFDARKLAEKIIKLVEEIADRDICIIQSGYFEKIIVEEQKEALAVEVIETVEELNKHVSKRTKNTKESVNQKEKTET